MQRIAQDLYAVVQVDAGFAGLAGSSQFWVQRGDKLYAVISSGTAPAMRARVATDARYLLASEVRYVPRAV